MEEMDNRSVYTAASVQEFLNYLLPNAEHWNSASRGELAYRGQASSCWALVPKAFRENQRVGYEPDAPTGGANRVVPQVKSEFRAVHRFVKEADRAGLQITEAGNRMLLQENPDKIFGDVNWMYNWPQDDILETLALAQHHGVPTRLLDFTEDPWTASYFAASSFWDNRKAQADQVGNDADEEHLAVWVIDLRFIRAINETVHRYPERIGEVRVPRANNPYLRAQRGFFLIDRGVNDVISRGGLLSLDEVIQERARFWNRKGIEQTWFDEVPVRKVRIHNAHTGDLLSDLENRGVTKGMLMPSLDRIVESLEFQVSVAKGVAQQKSTEVQRANPWREK